MWNAQLAALEDPLFMPTYPRGADHWPSLDDPRLPILWDTIIDLDLRVKRRPPENAAFSYGFGICLRNANDIFYAARIAYTYQNAGD